ncbi:MAG: AAA family ATPase [Spirochaetia bacterium]|jgi:predicted ATPase|nr:AAA family ATPase [Spirochaetia bacterium]
MRINKITLKNWKNFSEANVSLDTRLFIVGANASGKSNFLDALRFMRDIVKHGGGLQYALSLRGGLSKIRCLAARAEPGVGIKLEFSEDKNKWVYDLSIVRQQSGNHKPLIQHEVVVRNNTLILDRPSAEDKDDEERLTQTHLEQITTNKDFREIVRYLETIHYLHLVPQLLRFPEAFSGQDLPDDPFGKGFLQKVAKTPEKTRHSRLTKIQKVLQNAVPQLENLEYKEETGHPHLEVTYKHWRARGAKQMESQLSDGTLRLIGFLWMLLDGQGLLLLEEPELSLHPGIVGKLPALMYSVQRSKKQQPRQILLTTHSAELLSDRSISLSEIIMLLPENEGTKVEAANTKEDIKALLEGGLTPGESVMPSTAPQIDSGLSLQ